MICRLLAALRWWLDPGVRTYRREVRWAAADSLDPKTGDIL